MKIKIDRSSIKKNPNAGSTVSYIQGKDCATFTVKGELPDCLSVGKNCIIISLQENKYEKIYHGRLISEGVIDELIKLKNVLVERHFTNMPIYHDPIPEYSFEYENVEVICEYCHQRFMSDDFLIEDDGDYFTYNGCPKCGAYDCCGHVTYEKIEEVT